MPITIPEAPVFGEEREKRQRKQATEPGGLNPTVPQPTFGAGGTPGVGANIQEAANDAALAFIDRGSFGLLPALRDKIAQVAGVKQPTTAEMLAEAERRSPIATTTGAIGADVAQGALTGFGLGSAAKAAGTQIMPWVQRLAGGLLPQGADAFVRSQLSGQEENVPQQLALGTVRGAGPMIKQGLNNIPGVIGTLSSLVPDRLASQIGTATVERMRTASDERERDAERRRRETGRR
jgi:hypothetical protein